MPHCLAQRTALTAPSPTAPLPSSSPHSRNDRTTLAARCLRIVGWHRLERLLASIPDSNDDFGLV